MAINGIGGGLSAYTQYQNLSTQSTKKSADATKTTATNDSGVSVEFSDAALKAAEEAKGAETEAAEATQSSEAAETAESGGRTQADRDALIKSLNQQLDAHVQQMQNLVNELLGGKNKTEGWSLAETYRKFSEAADPETIEQAKKDIAEDGEWGVEKTSERMFEMAKALSGDDPTKADEMIEAVKKGFKQATTAWGEDLPEISGKTVDATIKKLEEWRDGLKNSSASDQAAAKTQDMLTAQAQKSYLAGVA